MSGKSQDYRVKMSREQILDLVKKAPSFIVYKDKDWEYPDHTSNNGNNVIMQMNFDVEKRAGIVIYIPLETDEQKRLLENP